MKKGQISTFIIVGIIIVFLTLTGVYYRTEIISAISELQIKPVAVSPEAQKLENFVIQCTKETATTGIELLGLQGGYIELPRDEIPVGNINMFSNKLESIQGLKTAYWYYQKDNKIPVENIPSKEEMSQELKEYIDATIGECIDDFSTFEGYKIQYRTPMSEVNIKDNEVQVTLIMPMETEIKGQKFSFRTFKTEIKTALGDLVNIAQQIVKNEIGSNYLEEKTIDMMVAYEEIPYSGTDLSCGTKTWAVEKVISDFKMILFENIPQIRVAFTDYELPDETHSYFEWHVTKKKYENINAFLFFSKSWPFYINIAPKEEGMLKAQQVTDKMGEVGFIAKSIFCMNDWNFVYDIKYPLLVTLYDKENDYTFQFAMQVVIDRNQPRKATIIPDEAAEADRDYCKFTRATKSTVYTYEERADNNLMPLEGVDIKYKCINHLCDVGTTSREREDALLSTEFPSCIGGSVTGEKEGYHKVEEIDVDSNQEFSLSLILEEIITKPIKIQVNREGGASSEPAPDETVVIELEEPEKGYRTLLIYPDQKTIKLIPGDYKVKEYVIKDGSPIKIPGREIETCVDIPKQGFLGLFGSTEPKCTKAKIPDTEITSLTTGGAEFEWTVNKNELYTSDYVKFYINTKPAPKSLEEISSINLNQDVLPPVFLQ
ncbi:MAG: hypothetical protein ISS23_04030 [Nanoarchaeota archaeon]|nr:hypothetical protein [Nanoarchaeota archaeon]